MNLLYNCTYKHTACRDVAFFIVEIEKFAEGVNVTGYWVNIAMKNPFFITAEGDPVTFFIQEEDIPKWELYEI